MAGATILGLDKTSEEHFNESYAKQTALHMAMDFGPAGAVVRVKHRLGNWTGDQRRDGDTPKAFWEMVLASLV